MTHADDERFLRRALRLAMNGRGGAEPNPLVGCVIVQGGRVIGEGFHARYGQPHAEPNALAACTASSAGATAYVTLEPCCHTNKQTPPCAPRLIAAGVARVVVGCRDPNPAVDGGGIAMLQSAGVVVDNLPALEPACRQLIAPFVSLQRCQRPYVTLKWAESADGKVAGPGGVRTQISNATASRVVHQLRARCDAIVVGINTVLSDDPLLTARGVESARPIVRYVLDRHLRIPITSRLVATGRELPLVVSCDTTALNSPTAKALIERGVGVRPLTSLERLRVEVATRTAPSRVTHVLVEPGPTLAAACFAEDFVDRVWVIRSPRVIGDATAPAAAAVPADYVETGRVDLAGDTLIEYLNPRSPSFAAAEPSADLVLARDGSAS